MGSTPAYLGPLDFYRRGDLTTTYTDYLQQRQFHDSHVIQVSRQTKELITAGNDALGAQIRQMKRLEEAQEQAAYAIVCSVRELKEATQEGFSAIGSVLEWGFAELILQAGRTNDLLDDILNALRTPSLTWAYEQFERARTLYRREHYKDALEALQYAIEGHGNNLGDKTEYRFHYLKGMVKLGSFENNDPAVVDLAGAEQAFVLASKYAAHDFPGEAADADLCAARAANLQGLYQNAVTHAQRGLRLCESAGLHYEVARALLQLSRRQEAKEHLKWAIRLHKHLLLRASGDPAFNAHSGFVEAAFSELQDELRKLGTVAVEALVEELRALRSVSYRSSVTGEVYGVDDQGDETIRLIRQTSHQLGQVCVGGGILDLRLVFERLPALQEQLEQWNNRYAERLRRALGTEVDRYVQSSRSQPQPALPSPNIAPGIGLCVAAFFFVSSCSRLVSLVNDPATSSLGDILGALFGMVAGPLVLGGGAYFIAEAVVNSARRDADAAKQGRNEQIEQFRAAIAAEQQSLSGVLFYRQERSLLKRIPAWATAQT